MYCVLCTVYCVLCTVYCVLCTVYCVLCTVYCVLCTVYCVLCTKEEVNALRWRCVELLAQLFVLQAERSDPVLRPLVAGQHHHAIKVLLRYRIVRRIAADVKGELLATYRPDVLCPTLHAQRPCHVLWYYGTMVLWYYGTMVLWYYGTMVLWYYGTMVLWYYGTMVLWYYGTMVLWYYGTMVLWYYGTMVLWYGCFNATLKFDTKRHK